MALRDYILCKRCECKLIYDGHDEIRDRLEEQYGDPDAPTYTPLLLCPDCIHALEEQVADLQGRLEKVAAIAKAKGEE